LEEQIERLKTVDTVSPIRTRLIYKNTIFELAGLIIQRLSEKNVALIFTKYLWQPIGIQNTFGKCKDIGKNKSIVQP